MEIARDLLEWTSPLEGPVGKEAEEDMCTAAAAAADTERREVAEGAVA